MKPERSPYRKSDASSSFTLPLNAPAPTWSPRSDQHYRVYEQSSHRSRYSSVTTLLPDREYVGTALPYPCPLCIPPKASALTGLGEPEKPSPLQPIAEKPSMSKTHEYFFIVNVCLAQFLALGGLAQSVAPLFIIGDYFGVDNAGLLSWYTAAFSLALGAFILPAGTSKLTQFCNCCYPNDRQGGLETCMDISESLCLAGLGMRYRLWL